MRRSATPKTLGVFGCFPSGKGHGWPFHGLLVASLGIHADRPLAVGHGNRLSGVVAEELKHPPHPLALPVDQQWDRLLQRPDADVVACPLALGSLEPVEKGRDIEQLGAVLHEVESDGRAGIERAGGAGHGLLFLLGGRAIMPRARRPHTHRWQTEPLRCRSIASASTSIHSSAASAQLRLRSRSKPAACA